jgi:hypothetical protein
MLTRLDVKGKGLAALEKKGQAGDLHQTEMTFDGVAPVSRGYGSSEVVKLVVRQSKPPRPCPRELAQHQPLPLGSQRWTFLNPSN